MRLAPAQAALEQALAHHQAERLEQAALGYARVRQLIPQQFEAWYLGGLVALQQAKAKAALPLFEQALRLQPRHTLTHFCRATALLQIGQREEAARGFEQTLRLDPTHAEAWANLGATHVQLGQLESAQAAYEKSTTLAPSDANNWSGLGSVHLLRGRPEQALACQERALRLAPNHPRAGFAAGQARFQLCDVAGALAAFDEHLQRRPHDLEVASQRLLLLNYGHAHTDAEIAQAHLQFGQQAAQKTPPSPAPAPPLRTRKRLIFISPDFRSHSVAYFLAPLLRHLDRKTFEVFLYYDYMIQDEVTQRFREGCEGWRVIVGLSDDEVASLIRTDAPDALIDLAGHTGSNRMTLFARRLAPLQATYLGYPNTTGLRTMDLRWVDAITDPPEYPEDHYTEIRERFAPCAWAYEPPREAPPPDSELGPDEPVVFGSFNNASKLSDDLLRTWAALLRDLPLARLVIKSSGLHPERFRVRLDRFGFPQDRVSVLGPTATTFEHLAHYRRIDIALDAFPYNGTTTTCEALYMGVPVVSRMGTAHASRVGASLLHAIGHSEWLAESDTEYTHKAQQLARDVQSLRAQRRLLREAMVNSVLFDYRGHAQAWGNALLKHLQRSATVDAVTP